MPPEEAQVKALLASQPIYTAQKDLFAFELLFRHDLFRSVEEYGEDRATSEVVLNLCTAINQQVNLFSRKIFINLSAGLLLADEVLPLPPDNTVIELPASMPINGALADGMKRWRDAGFSFALDGFDFSPACEPILEHVQYLKIDALEEPIDTIRAKMPLLADESVVWAVKRVETETQLAQFKELGFSLFQGYFLARPAEIQGQAIRGRINTSITTTNAVSNPDIEIDEMADLVRRDPSLATQLLKIVNSPVCNLLRPLNSVRDTIMYLGLIQVRKWIIMMSLLNETTGGSGAIHLVLTRAKACENYAAATLMVKSDQAFLVGLLSGVYLLFGVDNSVFLQQVSLQPEIKAAILEEQGILGQILSEVKRAEYASRQNSAPVFERQDPLLTAYYEASSWADSALKAAQ